MTKKDGVPEEVILTEKHVKLKDITEIFHSIESAKDKMLEADQNLDRRIIIHQGIEKMLTLLSEVT